MEIRCVDCEGFLANDLQLGKNQGKIRWVLLINFLMMGGEIFVGYYSKSMSLMAEGWHMGSHVGALSITLLAYRLARSHSIGKKLSFGAGKLIPLGGYTSALILGIVSLLVLFESTERLFSPVDIQFSEAIGIAILGLGVNIVSAWILHGGGHAHAHHHDHDDHEHDHHEHHDGHDHAHVHDHNIRSAFLHIIADAVTSVLAIAALIVGKFLHVSILDSLVGIVGAFVILSWAFQLLRDTGWELLDGHSKTIDWARLRSLVETDGNRILDFHVWRIAPRAIACELVVDAQVQRGLEHYRRILREEFSVRHLVVEERHLSK